MFNAANVTIELLQYLDYGSTFSKDVMGARNGINHVCFEVDDVADLAHWSSVVAWGTYEELTGPLEERASTLLLSRFGPMRTSITALKHPRFHGIAQEGSRTNLFRIRLTEKTGRFER